MWFDSHAHLTAPDYDTDREEVLQRARAARIDTVLTIGSGYGVAEFERAPALAGQHDFVYASVGVHPHNATLLDDAGRAALRAHLQKPKVVAIGECGLDYHYMHSPRDIQQKVLREQLVLARELDLPVCIHVRSDGDEAYDDLLTIWDAENDGTLRGLLHCYTGSLEFAKVAIERDFYVSFSGILSFKKSEALRETARALPLERLLIETDAPFLAPEGFRGKRNEPAHVAIVGETLAKARGESVEAIAFATTKNAKTFFRIPG